MRLTMQHLHEEHAAREHVDLGAPAILPADDPAQAVPFAEFTRRDWYIFKLGQQYGHESRQWEIDAAENAFKQADYDADRYYRAAFDHDNHDCAIHANKGRYKGASTRLLHWGYWADEEEQFPPDDQ